MVIATLYLARVVLVPFALAMLLSFLLTPCVAFLERIRLPRALAVLLVVGVFVAAMGSVGWVVTNQLVDVTSQIPSYKANITTKIESLRTKKGQSINKATATMVELGKELAAAPTSDPAAKPGAPEPASQTHPLAVEVVSPPTNLLDSARDLLGPLGTTGIVIVFAVFMLMRREDLRNRFIRLAGQGRLNVMTQAMDEAAQRVSRYVFLQCVASMRVTGWRWAWRSILSGSPMLCCGAWARESCGFFPISARRSERHCRFCCRSRCSAAGARR